MSETGRAKRSTHTGPTGIATQAVVWASLVAATVASWLVGSDHGAAFGPALATVAVVGITFAKIAAIGAYFMDVRRATIALRVIFAAWISVVGAVVLVLSLLALP